MHQLGCCRPVHEVSADGRARRRIVPQLDGMVPSMATRKVTVTLEEEQLDRARRLVESGAASSVTFDAGGLTALDGPVLPKLSPAAR